MQVPRFPTNTPIDKILGGGLEKGAITNIFGPPGSGKTNVALCSLLNVKSAFYVDTEGSFSPERFYQLGGSAKKMQAVVLVEPGTWQEQHKCILQLESSIKKSKPEIIIVDSLVALYRLELDGKNFQQVNRQLATQYSVLSKIARTLDIPVLVTNQVYSTGEDVELTSRQIARYWSKCLIELKRGKKVGHRIALLRKHRSLPEGKEVQFEIKQNSLKEVKLGLF